MPSGHTGLHYKEYTPLNLDSFHQTQTWYYLLFIIPNKGQAHKAEVTDNVTAAERVNECLQHFSLSYSSYLATGRLYGRNYNKLAAFFLIFILQRY